MTLAFVFYFFNLANVTLVQGIPPLEMSTAFTSKAVCELASQRQADTNPLIRVWIPDPHGLYACVAAPPINKSR